MIMNKTDCYKLGHVFQYPENTQVIYSNFTPRSDKLFAHKSIFWDRRVVVFGIQALIARMVKEFNETFFSVEKEKACRTYARRVKSLLGPAAGADISHVEALHDLGYLPIMIKALPEGTRVPVGVPVLTIYNTVREMFWLVNYLETYMSCELWKPMTCATIAYEYRRTLDHYAAKTGVSPLFVQWQGHDFGYRGMSNSADAAACGAGHLLSFTGTDTVPALDFLEEYYFADSDKELIGGSVPATEHSVMCAGGSAPEEELETFRRLLEDLYPSGIVSIVSDTWDYWDVITNKAAILKDKIEARGYDTYGNSKVVFRPDSSDPVRIICGYRDDELTWNEDNEIVSIETGQVLTDAEIKGSVRCLFEIFGGSINEKGYVDLSPRVGLIYGDSITLARCEEICSRLEQAGFSTSCIVFGIGSFTYQYNTRDSLGFAMKATYAMIDDTPKAMLKDPRLS